MNSVAPYTTRRSAGTSRSAISPKRTVSSRHPKPKSRSGARRRPRPKSCGERRRNGRRDGGSGEARAFRRRIARRPARPWARRSPRACRPTSDAASTRRARSSRTNSPVSSPRRRPIMRPCATPVSRRRRRGDLRAAPRVLAQIDARQMPLHARGAAVPERLVAVAAAAHAGEGQQSRHRRRQCASARQRRARRDRRGSRDAKEHELAGRSQGARADLQGARRKHEICALQSRIRRRKGWPQGQCRRSGSRENIRRPMGASPTKRRTARFRPRGALAGGLRRDRHAARRHTAGEGARVAARGPGRAADRGFRRLARSRPRRSSSCISRRAGSPSRPRRWKSSCPNSKRASGSARWSTGRNSRRGATRNFPDREQPTGEILDRLPSPRADRHATPEQREEALRIAGVRNPTVVRVQNEMRKVVNNLIEALRQAGSDPGGARARSRQVEARARGDQRGHARQGAHARESARPIWSPMGSPIRRTTTSRNGCCGRNAASDAPTPATRSASPISSAAIRASRSSTSGRARNRSIIPCATRRCAARTSISPRAIAFRSSFFRGGPTTGRRRRIASGK